ncbi:hypothetical protein A2721_00285 [Candidatus Gottesmanbacteria bacterium RIFCSPHIGHO2_01_FULL_47_48]|uniref:Type II toxin-antitoxin system mRNA interferase toxin, RelE/StbE family n=1 Tax=Candidatus Gottesmanbacteria bacterium RIFCSPHIGHO2_01_FULL_47_48 TaxID=1798381 RepID=A0A1F6A4R2_9BACT|nr:MAG: hypothetical protein A2721_00285 [Candidatus Gottesmanbacteria bacterium RIFCSPHIGHO2_01_FULL_47_48]
MQINFSRNFRKSYRKRVANDRSLDKKFKERLILFRKDPLDSILHNHKLAGDKSGFWAFSITGDVRVVYLKEGDDVLLYDIGSHNQVY